MSHEDVMQAIKAMHCPRCGQSQIRCCGSRFESEATELRTALAESERQLREVRAERDGLKGLRRDEKQALEEQVAYHKGAVERLQDNLRASLDETRAVKVRLTATIDQQRARIEELEHDITRQITIATEYVNRALAAEKDAERYRWLRDLPDVSPHEQIGNFPGDMWDEAIDAARDVKEPA